VSSARARLEARGAASLYASCLALGALMALSACATDYELRRDERSPATVGELSYELITHEASLSRRARVERLTRLAEERVELIESIDGWLSWPTLHAVADELYAWGFLYDEPMSAELLRASAAQLERLAASAEWIELARAEALRARLGALSPYAPSPLERLLTPGFGAPLSSLLSWLAAHDGTPSPQRQEPDRSAHLRLLLSALHDTLSQGEPLPQFALDGLSFLFRELSAHRAPSPQLSYEPRASAALPFEQLLSAELSAVDWLRPESYQAPLAQDLRQSVVYGISAGLGLWWSEGAFGAAHELVEALLGAPRLVDEPLIGGAAYAYLPSTTLTPIMSAALDLIDHPVSPGLLGYLGAKLPASERAIAGLLNDLARLQERHDQAAPVELGTPELRGRGLAPDLIAALADLLLFNASTTPRSPWDAPQGAPAPLLSAHEASLSMFAELLTILDDPALLALPRVSALMMESEEPAQGGIPPLGGGYDRCALSCEERHQASASDHLLCLESCPRSQLLARQPPERLESQSALERSLALIRDFSGRAYQMRVISFRSDFFEALSEGTPLDPALLPPLLEIDDVAATFLSSVIGELSLDELVSPSAIGDPQIELMLEGFDTLCEEGSVGNDLLNNLLPSLIEVSEELLAERCARFTDSRALGDGEAAKRAQIGTLVTMLSLLTDVPMSPRPTTGELIRFFNLESPSVSLGLLELELSQLRCAAGFALRAHHGYALYAGEAAGLYQALSPLIRVSHRYGKLPSLARLLGTIYSHYGLDERPQLMANGQPELSAGTGLVYLEPSLELLLSEPAAPRLLSQLSALLSDSGLSESLSPATGNAADAWREAQWAATLGELEFSEGAWATLRAQSAALGEPVWRDTVGAPSSRAGLMLGALVERALSPAGGPSAQGRLNALWRSVDYLLSELERAPEREARVEEALTLIFELIKELFERNSGALSPELSSQRPLWISAAALSWAAEQLAERSAQNPSPLYEEATRLDELITQPALFSFMSLARDLRSSPEGRALDALLAPLWADPLSLSAALYQLAALMTTPQLERLGVGLAPLLKPDQEPPVIQELLNLSDRVARESAWEGWEELLRGALLRPPPRGDEPLGSPPEAPLIRLFMALVDLGRAEPTERGPWSAEDMSLALTELARWLRDSETGMVKALQIISERALESPESP